MDMHHRSLTHSNLTRTTMMFLIVTCLIATSYALPAQQLVREPSSLLEEAKDKVEEIASSFAQNANEIKDSVEEHIISIPQQISESVHEVQEAIAKPISENQDSYVISFNIPKPSVPSWLPSLPPVTSIHLPNFSNWHLPSFLHSRGRLVPGVSSPYNGKENQINARQLNAENDSEEYIESNEEEPQQLLILALPIPKPGFPSFSPFSWPFPFVVVPNLNAN